VEGFRSAADDPADDLPSAEPSDQQDDPPAVPLSAVRKQTSSGRPAGKTKSPRKTRAPRKAQAGRAQEGAAATSARQRQRSSFPATSFEAATEIATVMHKLGGARIRRLTIFEDLDRSPDSGHSRQLVTNSGRYGITSGSYASEWLQLTDLGAQATSPDLPSRTVKRAQFQLAIEQIAPFKALFDEYVDRKMPSHAVMRDFLREGSWAGEDLQALIDTFIVNAKYVGVLRTVSGSERLVNLDHALDLLPSPSGAITSERTAPTAQTAAAVDWSRVCFYVSPIGEIDSPERQHSDLFLGHLVEPATAEFGFTVVRADAITVPGMITSQVIEHVAKARIVIADLSFHNANVFYELALRHARRLPIVQLIRLRDKLPFDLGNFRTVTIDDTDLYAFVPKMETYRSEIASHIREALADGAEVANPITAYFPDFWSGN
jgi:hypothetical protein